MKSMYQFFTNHKRGVRFLLIALAISCHFNPVFSQTPIKEWDADFGGSDGEFLYSLDVTNDGGYILGGYSESGASGDKSQPSQGSSDYWVVKTNDAGAKQWDKRFGGSSVDEMFAVEQTSDGGYILGGYSFSGISGDKTQSNQGQNDFWIVKTDANGTKQWDKRFGGSNFEELHALQQTSDGGYILGGISMSGSNGDKTQTTQGGYDFWIVKTDASGNKEWDARFGGSQFDVLNSLQETSDGGYILGGYSLSGISGDKTQASKGASDFWVVKTNANGVKEWDASFGGNSDDWLTSLEQTTDGGYILGGWSWSGATGDKTQPTKGDNDYWLVKIDANGIKEWDADFGGSSNDYANAVVQATDGGYALAGYSSSPISGDKTQSSIGGTDYWMVKTNASGIKQWDVQFGGTDFDFLSDMEQTADGGFVFGGYSSSPAGGDKSQPTKGLNDYWIVKSSSGVVPCNTPSNLVTVSVNSSQAYLDWDDVPGAVSYLLRYKVAGASTWIPVKTINSSRTIKNLSADTKYIWQVKAVCQQQPKISSDWSAKETFTTSPLRLSAASEIATMEVYPNPVTSSAILSFSLSEESNVMIDIKDVNGRSMAQINEDHLSAGNHEVQLDLTSFSSGIYFVELKAGGGLFVKKIIKD